MAHGLKTAVLMAGFTALLGGVGFAIGRTGGLFFALLLAAGMNGFAWWHSDRLVLRLYRAREASEHHAPELYRLVRELSQRAGLPMPKVYLIDEAQPNAFATGRNPQHAAVAATTGLISLLTARELRGVLAHELAHIQNRDTLISTVSATMAGAISMLANWALWLGHGRGNQRSPGNPLLLLLLTILAPIAAMLIQFAISRSREYGADEVGAHIAGDAEALAMALEKIERYAQGLPLPAAEAHPETAQMMIINPLSGAGLNSLFSTHPPTTKRIARLRELAHRH